MYKVSSDKRQRALHQGRPTDWVGGEEVQTESGLRNNLVRAAQNLEERIKGLPKGSPERRQLGLEKLAIQNQLNAARVEQRAENILLNSDISWCFVTVVREQALPAQFRAWWAAAKRMREKNGADAEKVRAEMQDDAGLPSADDVRGILRDNIKSGD